ncbi:hypothetical protein BG011_006110 [Mortierella polycephala]|uniref:glucan endo-1,3-beta-D-glucosidase n=1 Tax=Mortierella polycephala TaxID=41804 RepID=A0A9P6U016_9FUNG|nr:hypothetical protein BG011_006110 [Mortierella polycephala]
MSHYNSSNHFNNRHRQEDPQEDANDDDFKSTSAFQMEQYMTPQQRRQQERRQHAEYSTSAAAAATAAAAAGSGTSTWLSKQKKKSNRCKTMGCAVFILLALALAGVLAWYFAVHKKNQEASNGKLGNGNHAAGPTVIAPNGNVIPNPNYALKRVFYGMAYVPLDAQLPGCFNTQASVDQELQLLVQTTGRVRLYGTDCNVLKYTLDAIQRLKLDLKVVVGIWIDKDDATYTRQTTEFYNVVSIYGWSNIIGISVGNEVIFDNYQPLSVLLAHVAEVKAKVVAMGQPNIPVFTSDLESANRPPLTQQEDKAGVNLHPFFAGVPVADAASWFWKYLLDQVEPTVNSGNPQPIDIWVTEVGWPTFPAGDNVNASIPSIPNLQTFLDTWLCEANSKNLPYYFFEFFDAPWKIWPGSAVEGFWGLLTIDKKLKVKLPDCLAQ